MIVQWFADMFYKVLTGLLNWINIPHIPDDMFDSINDVLDLISTDAIGLFKFFVPENVINIGVPIVAVIFAFKYGYYFIMWILSKIPAMNIH